MPPLKPVATFWGFPRKMFIDEDVRGICMFILGKIVDEDDPDTFRGTIFFSVHPTHFGHNL